MDEEGDEANDDHDPVEIITQVQTLTVKAPRSLPPPSAPPAPAAPIDPFTRRLRTDPNDTYVQTDTVPEQATPTMKPSSLFAPNPFRTSTTPPSQPSQGSSNFAQMFAPTTSAGHSLPERQYSPPITILGEHAGSYGPHTIAPHHVFLNYCPDQIDTLYSAQQPGDILIIIWGKEYRHLTMASEYKLEAMLKTYFQGEQVDFKIAVPHPREEQPLGGYQNRANKDHTGAPFPFYIRGLTPEQKARILDDAFIPTNFDSYIIMDPSDFITDFAFTVDGVDAPPTIQGQRLVEKLVKDKIYASNRVWTFLRTHHDAVGPAIPHERIPAMVITSMEARGIWIEGRGGEPGRQAWNMWIAHPTKIPAFHLDWIAALKSALPTKSGVGVDGEVHAIRVPFFCKGCKGGSHPTSQCPLKAQLGEVLKKPQEEGIRKQRNGNRGGRGGRTGTYGGRFANA
ncbi:hypothetical protein EV421DRAFT_1376188 [Armillaria borealis]|uniref:Uncharacterized protein n=1 Tax=Armillaria borealis TaxID=47425 RepID=A0AA39MGQ6_9AGAR|nr:hypothetical protein EV421DRAFT_1376188 [Armillaria borealis]